MRNSSGLSDPSIDARRRFVRVRHLRDDGFVEFDFATGDPEFYAMLIKDSTIACSWTLCNSFLP